MENQKILDYKSVKGFIKGSLVLVGLFAVLYCGVATLLLRSDKNVDISKSIQTSNNIDVDNDKDDKNKETSINIVTDRKIVEKNNNIVEKNIKIYINVHQT